MIIFSLVPLLSFVAYSALIYITLRHKPTRIVHKTFILYLLGVTLWAGFAFLLYTNLFPERASLLSHLMLISALFSVVAYYHFLRTFMDKPSGIGVFLGYAVILFVIPLIMQNRVTYIIKSPPMLGAAPHIEYTLIGVSVLAVGAIALVSLTIVSLLQKYRRSTDPLERNKITYLLVGFLMVVIFGLTKVHPVVTRYPLAHLGNLANAALITYAIVKYQLLDITLVIRRGLVYALTGLCSVALYLVLLFGVLQPLDLESHHAVLIAGAVVTVLVAILFYPTRDTFQEWLERFVYKETYDYRRLLLSFADKMNHVLDLDELAEYMLTLITRGTHAKEACLFLPESGSGDFLLHYAMPTQGNPCQGMKLAKDNPVVTWLAQEGRPFNREQIDIIPQMNSLWEREREELKASEIELFFPIRNKGALIGILTVGTKSHSAHYRSEDLDAVMTMSSEAGVVIENAQLYAAAKMRANTDELTGLFNHRYFHERLEEEISRGLRLGVILSLLFLDLDLFKRYNDIYGHLAGDDILRQVGDTFRSSLRSIDMAFRYGGDEFAVILPGTSTTDARKVAERIRKNLEQVMNSKEIPITFSVGVASWPADGVMRDALIQRADSALYHAKRWGNRTCLASELIPSGVSPPELSSTVKQGMLSTIYALAATVDARDHHTYGHSRRVSNYAVTIAEAIGLHPERIAVLHTAGLLHDIGKIGISDEVLNKTALLDEDEWKPVHSHPTLGVSILKHIDGLAACLPGIQYHHERYDGSGYPSGLKGNNIPLDARIIAIADAYEAMTAPRPYREGTLTREEALTELECNMGTQFDPELVKVFVRIMKQNSLIEARVA